MQGVFGMFSGAAQLALLRRAQTCSLAGKKMPEILEERFERAKSGLMLAPAKAQAFSLMRKRNCMQHI
jgi:hypothetical protein